jgi:uncharacterized protein YcfL
MKKLTLLFLSLLMLCGCNNKTDYTSFEIDNKEYKWSIDYENQGKLIVYNSKTNEIKYDISLMSYKIVYDDNISSTKAILYCYGDKQYLLVVGI